MRETLKILRVATTLRVVGVEEGGRGFNILFLDFNSVASPALILTKVMACCLEILNFRASSLLPVSQASVIVFDLVVAD